MRSGQARETFRCRRVAKALIVVGCPVEVPLSLGVPTGIADRAAAFGLAGSCAVTEVAARRRRSEASVPRHRGTSVRGRRSPPCGAAAGLPATRSPFTNGIVSAPVGALARESEGLTKTEPWRIGVLFSRSGATSAVEQTQLNGTLLALAEINAAGGVLSRPVEAVVYDPASNPKTYRQLAERLLAVDRVKLIFGCYMSSTRKVVVPVVEAHRALLFYPTLYEGFEYSPNCIYTGPSPNQNSLQLARYLIEIYGNRFLLVGSNYIYPYESNRIMADLVVQSRGKVLDEIYVPLEAEAGHFERVITKVAKLKPDVIFSTVVGRATAILYQAFHDAGFDAADMPIASLTTSEAEVADMPAAVAAGHITAAPFFEALTTPAAERFVRDYKAMFGAESPVPAGAEAAYFQVHLAAQAMRRAGTDNPERLLEELRGAEFDAPQGRVRIDPDNNHTFLWPRVARIDDQRRFQTVWNPGLRVKPDPYCVLQSLDDWSAESLLRPRARPDAV